MAELESSKKASLSGWVTDHRAHANIARCYIQPLYFARQFDGILISDTSPAATVDCLCTFFDPLLECRNRWEVDFLQHETILRRDEHEFCSFLTSNCSLSRLAIVICLFEVPVVTLGSSEAILYARTPYTVSEICRLNTSTIS